MREVRQAPVCVASVVQDEAVIREDANPDVELLAVVPGVKDDNGSEVGAPEMRTQLNHWKRQESNAGHLLRSCETVFDFSTLQSTERKNNSGNVGRTVRAETVRSGSSCSETSVK